MLTCNWADILTKVTNGPTFARQTASITCSPPVSETACMARTKNCSSKPPLCILRKFSRDRSLSDIHDPPMIKSCSLCSFYIPWNSLLSKWADACYRCGSDAADAVLCSNCLLPVLSNIYGIYRCTVCANHRRNNRRRER